MEQPNMNSHYKVKNVNGTSEAPYCCSESKYLNDGTRAYSWLSVWENSTGTERKSCARWGCKTEYDDLVGAHVIIVDKRCSNEWYIVPLCKGSECNHCSNTDSMFIVSDCPLVSVRMSQGKHVVI